MNVIGGVVRPDGGGMVLDGLPYAPQNPADASRAGIAFIHQELNLFSNLSIAENIFIDRFPRRRFGLVDRAAMRARARDLLAEVDLDLAPETPVERLSPGERQLVEVAKALQLDAAIIIFDEPTTSLTARETERLFGLIERLRQSGKSMIYISHILGDVMRVADDIAVLRDGELTAFGPGRGIRHRPHDHADDRPRHRAALPRAHIRAAARNPACRRATSAPRASSRTSTLPCTAARCLACSA